MCIFCKIINGEIPSAKVYEDEDVLAFLDISQATKGHTLVVPKKHFDNLLEIEDYEYLKVMSVAKEIAKAQTKAFNADGINLVNNCKEAAGQAVNHFHVHVVPRYVGDDFKITPADHGSEYNLEEIKNAIAKEIE